MRKFLKTFQDMFVKECRKDPHNMAPAMMGVLAIMFLILFGIEWCLTRVFYPRAMTFYGAQFVGAIGGLTFIAVAWAVFIAAVALFKTRTALRH